MSRPCSYPDGIIIAATEQRLEHMIHGTADHPCILAGHRHEIYRLWCLGFDVKNGKERARP